MWQWLKDKTNAVLTTIGQAQLAEAEANRAMVEAFLPQKITPRPTSQPTPPPREEVPLTGHIWSMDPETQIATRMRVVKVPVGTSGAWDYSFIPTHEKRLIPHSSTHKDTHGNYVLDPLPAGGTMVNGVPVFSRRAGHHVAAIDAGHGVVKPVEVKQKDGSIKIVPSYDVGSASPANTGAGAHVTEDVINLHLAQNAAVAFATRGWDTIVTRTTNQTYDMKKHPEKHMLRDGGFGFRIDAANQADVNISLHGDQRTPLPGKTEKDVQGVRIYTDARIQKGDRSLEFANYLNDPSKPGDIIQDGYVRRPNYKMINGERIRGPVSVLAEPGAINLPHDASKMRSVTFWHNFGARLAEKVEEFFFHPVKATPKPVAQSHGAFCDVTIPLTASPQEISRIIHHFETAGCAPQAPATKSPASHDGKPDRHTAADHPHHDPLRPARTPAGNAKPAATHPHRS